MSKIRDYTGREDWTSTITDWDWYVGDIIIGTDPQQRCGEDTYAVHEIVDDGEYVQHSGLFWEKEKAEIYAQALTNERQRPT